jgi:alkylation response protein AidB-like acyl-CoA dehydrogenase
MMPIPRTLFDGDHEAFRDTVRRFMEQEVAPHHARWEAQTHVDREVWTRAGAAGFLCASMPEEYGGVGVDKRFSVIVMEEAARINATGLGWGLHSEIVAPYLLHYGSETLKRKYLPQMASGEMIAAIAMTEPGAGSDLQGLRTTAVRDGDHYVLNGSKIFITNGYLCDLVIVAAKTDPAAIGTRSAKGTSLLVVDTSMAGFSKAKPLHKAGMKAQDTCELFFDNVRVPAENLLGEEGNGFVYLMQELPWERLQIAVIAMASAEAALDWTIQYTNERKAFGRRSPSSRTPVSSWPSSRPRSRSAASSSTAASNCCWTTSSTRRRPRWPSTGAPICNSRLWTSACSCMAATATCGTTRSPAPGPMRACSASTAVPTKS